MTCFVNSTTDYHRLELDTLGWELTVCNSLQPDDSPCREVLMENDSFGRHLFRFLLKEIPLHTIDSILEIGGGYGYVMRDFLCCKPSFKATMIDISPFLLEQQIKTLGNQKATYISEDFFRMDVSFYKSFDMVLLNENLGDFPTLCNISKEELCNESIHGIPELERTREIFKLYSLPLPDYYPFNFNLGAAEAVIKLCDAEIPYIFLSEHSSEAQNRIQQGCSELNTVSDNPQKISLRGHDEYTVKFSQLEAIAHHKSYSIKRGSYKEILPLKDAWDTSGPSISVTLPEDHLEIIEHFLDDLNLYEYLILSKKRLRRADSVAMN